MEEKEIKEKYDLYIIRRTIPYYYGTTYNIESLEETLKSFLYENENALYYITPRSENCDENIKNMEEMI